MRMKFGVVLQGRQFVPSWDEIKEIALKAEDLGFHSLWVSDHLLHPFQVEGKPKFYCHEAWTVASALAALTKRIKLSFHVLVPAFRGPSILAKMATTLDIISGGRLIMCLGAGWFKEEYDAFGIPWEEHDDRIDKLKEAILIMRALWTQDNVTFNGKYYNVKNALIEPKPLQKPHPPIWIGGNSPKSMELAAELADGWYSRQAPPEKMKEDIDFIRKRTKKDRMDFAVTMEIRSIDNQDQIIENLLKYAEAGVTHLTITFFKIEDLERFARDILPTI